MLRIANKARNVFVVLVAVALPTLSLAAAPDADPDKWTFGVEVYAWGAAIGIETIGGNDIDISFSDIIDNLDLTVMAMTMARKGNWTVLADVIYMDLDDDQNGAVNFPNHPNLPAVSTYGKVQMQAFIGTLEGGYKVFESESTRLDAMLGARYLDVDVDLTLDVGSFGTKASDSEGNWDGIVGLLGKTNLGEKWYLTYYADVGTGQSDLTWQALASLSYRFKHVDAAVGYRYLDYEFDNDNVEFLDSLDISGPYAGVKFWF
jgi:hypothetical protein